MGKRAFYWSWAKRSVYRSIGWGDFAGGLAGNGLTIFAHTNPAWTPTVNDLAWQIPIFSLAGAMLLRVAIAPYELWKEQKDRADQAEKRLREVEPDSVYAARRATLRADQDHKADNLRREGEALMWLLAPKDDQ